jgi:hypothetical protein
MRGVDQATKEFDENPRSIRGGSAAGVVREHKNVAVIRVE